MKPHSDRIPDHDRNLEIDRVLTALGNRQPPAHMERRILAALESAPASTSRWPRWTSGTFAPARRQMWSIGACAAVIVFAAIAISDHRQPRGTSVAVAPAASVTVGLRTPMLAAELAHKPVAHALRAAAKGIAPRAAAWSRATSVNQPRTILCDCDPTAVAEANAPSLPAPPLPLTAQEKLLLRIAHHPNPMELAELDPQQREASIAQERAANRQFFHSLALAPPPEPSPQVETSTPPAPSPQPDPQPQPSNAAPHGDQP